MYLIDTQIFIWTLVRPETLSAGTKRILENEFIFVSQISLFEITIKQKIGKLPELALSTNELANRVGNDGFNLLDLKTKHLEAYTKIPLKGNHRDPFDRLLLATALSENLANISADENFKLYAPQVSVFGND